VGYSSTGERKALEDFDVSRTTKYFFWLGTSWTNQSINQSLDCDALPALPTYLQVKHTKHKMKRIKDFSTKVFLARRRRI